MLLMVATQARKAETRQGSRKGLQEGWWHVEEIAVDLSGLRLQWSLLRKLPAEVLLQDN